MVKIKHEADKCIGCGACVALAPEFFEMEGSKAKLKGAKHEQGFDVLEGDFSAEEVEHIKQAAESCPVGIIHVEE